MQFEIRLAGAQPDLDAIQHALFDVDPASQVDLDASGDTLRVHVAVNADGLRGLLTRVGLPLDRGQVKVQPSTCCGGCGG